MDALITLIIIIITVVSVVSRIRTKEKSKSGARPAAGSELGTKLKAFFTEIQRSFEEQTPKGPAGASRWQRLQDAGQAKGPPERSYELSYEDLELEEEKPPAAPVKKAPVRRPASDSPKPAVAPPVDSAPAPCAPKPLDAGTASCPESLRKAVVWSEILGPPVALRDAPWER
jgi:hypothetical protein